MAPRKFLALTAGFHRGLLGLFLPPRPRCCRLFVVGLGFANIFPLVFSTAVEPCRNTPTSFPA